jgi:hypothetical protein
MRTRPAIPRQNDPALAGFTSAVADLSDVWSSLMWLESRRPELIAIRRDIARWARETNQAVLETFGHGSVSDEVRVLLNGLPDCARGGGGDAGHDLLVSATGEALRLTTTARSIEASITGVAAP